MKYGMMLVRQAGRVGQMCFLSVVQGRKESCKEEKGSGKGECEMIIMFSGFLLE